MNVQLLIVGRLPFVCRGCRLHAIVLEGCRNGEIISDNERTNDSDSDNDVTRMNRMLDSKVIACVPAVMRPMAGHLKLVSPPVLPCSFIYLPDQYRLGVPFSKDTTWFSARLPSTYAHQQGWRLPL